MKLVRLTVFVFAVALTAVATTQAQNVAPSAPSLQGTLWQGNETLQSPGFLAFGFNPNGKVKMMDDSYKLRNGPIVNGTWSQQGSQLEIRFKNCVYKGQINGNTLSGTATMIMRNGQVQTWNFALSLVNNPQTTPAPLPAPVPGGFGNPQR